MTKDIFSNLSQFEFNQRRRSNSFSNDNNNNNITAMNNNNIFNKNNNNNGLYASFGDHLSNSVKNNLKIERKINFNNKI